MNYFIVPGLRSRIDTRYILKPLIQDLQAEFEIKATAIFRKGRKTPSEYEAKLMFAKIAVAKGIPDATIMKLLKLRRQHEVTELLHRYHKRVTYNETFRQKAERMLASYLK